MNITVYCGARVGSRQSYSAAAERLGDYMAKNGHTLIYGAGRTGIMGVLSESVLSGGGKAIGVVPDFLDKPEMVSDQLTEKYVVSSMAERKQRMFELGELFIALPGGLGTLEEISDILSWRHLGRHNHHAVFLNIDGFYEPIKEQMRCFVKEGFLPASHFDEVTFANSPEDLFHLVEEIENRR